jgi:hypothetical protein
MGHSEDQQFEKNVSKQATKVPYEYPGYRDDKHWKEGQQTLLDELKLINANYVDVGAEKSLVRIPETATKMLNMIKAKKRRKLRTHFKVVIESPPSSQSEYIPAIAPVRVRRRNKKRTIRHRSKKPSSLSCLGNLASVARLRVTSVHALGKPLGFYKCKRYFIGKYTLITLTDLSLKNSTVSHF